MHVQFNPGSNMEARKSLGARVEALVTEAVGHFAGHITRVEVYVSDDSNARNGGNDKRCTMEARIAGREPVAVTHHAATLREAMAGAAEKLQRSLGHTLGRVGDRRAG